jgi:hypothetical protein
MSNNISIFVADGYPMLLKGLVVELKEYNYEVVATAVNGARFRTNYSATIYYCTFRYGNAHA